MQFNNINNRTADLFDDTISASEKEKIRQQSGEISDSADDLEFINLAAAVLTPASEIKASKTFKTNVMKKIQDTSETVTGKPGKIVPFLRPGWKKIASVAAILLIALLVAPIFGPRLFNPNAKAMSLLNTSIEALVNIKSMIINYQVRSVPGDNLDLIDTKGDFIEYTLWKEFAPAEKWRIEKPGLAVAMDGQKQYKYMEKAGIGYVGSPQAGFVEWMRILLDPEKILQDEKSFAAKYKADYKIEKTNTETILTVKAKALGNFKNTYLLNATIPESNNRRIYHFDKNTNRLQSLEIYVTENKSEVLVLKISNIAYDAAIAEGKFNIQLPEGTKWVELKDIQPKKEKATTASSAEEAAKLWWKALSEKDWETVFKLNPSLEQSANIESIKQEFGGLQILSIGESFKSGLYPGEFVPYKVKLKSGEIKEFNLAVRNDNPDKVWEIDGGF